jgi:uncharacterized membrane protein YwaF
MEAEPFILFGTGHLITLLIVLLITLLVPLFLKKTSSKTKDWFGYLLALTLLLDFLVKPYYWTQFFDYELIEVFPLHMCSLSSISIAIYLLIRKKIFYEVAFFWLPPSPSLALDNRPKLDSLKRVLIVSFIFLAVIYLINWILGPPANYWYLGARPDGASIMDLMPEPPRHIPIVVTLGIIMFSLIYLPFLIYDRIKPRGVVLKE